MKKAFRLALTSLFLAVALRARADEGLVDEQLTQPVSRPMGTGGWRRGQWGEPCGGGFDEVRLLYMDIFRPTPHWV